MDHESEVTAFKYQMEQTEMFWSAAAEGEDLHQGSNKAVTQNSKKLS